MAVIAFRISLRAATSGNTIRSTAVVLPILIGQLPTSMAAPLAAIRSQTARLMHASNRLATIDPRRVLRIAPVADVNREQATVAPAIETAEIGRVPAHPTVVAAERATAAPVAATPEIEAEQAAVATALAIAAFPAAVVAPAPLVVALAE
jgi:hypothetical protein